MLLSGAFGFRISQQLNVFVYHYRYYSISNRQFHNFHRKIFIKRTWYAYIDRLLSTRKTNRFVYFWLYIKMLKSTSYFHITSHCMIKVVITIPVFYKHSRNGISFFVLVVLNFYWTKNSYMAPKYSYYVLRVRVSECKLQWIELSFKMCKCVRTRVRARGSECV